MITSEFPPQPGGIGNHAYNLAKQLQTAGNEVTVLCDVRSKTGEAEGCFDGDAGFRILRIRRRKVMFFSYLKRIKTAFSLVSSHDIVLSSGKYPLWLGALLTFFYKRKYVAVIHGTEICLPNKLLRKLTIVSLRRFSELIAVSNYTKSLIKDLGLKNLHVIFNGFDIEKPFSKAKKNFSPTLITVGKVARRKGQQNVIKALPLLLKKYPQLKYHIVGIPTETEKLQKLAVQLGVEQATVFHGKVSEDEKVALLAQADIFVMLSQSTKAGDVEGFGIAILEANALGVPAIGATGCGIEDAIQDGFSGRLVAPGAQQELLDAIMEIESSYDRFSENAEQWAGNFTWDKIGKRYLEILRKE